MRIRMNKHDFKTAWPDEILIESEFVESPPNSIISPSKSFLRFGLIRDENEDAGLEEVGRLRRREKGVKGTATLSKFGKFGWAKNSQKRCNSLAIGYLPKV